VQSYCRPCAAQKIRARREGDKSGVAVVNRRSKLKRKYGISLDDYAALLERQGGKCAICKATEPRGRAGHFGPVFHVDHCHQTGRIRGLLCSTCNPGLGAFGDSVERLQAAIDYLKGGAT
jgi:hypothetical protein